MVDTIRAEKGVTASAPSPPPKRRWWRRGSLPYILLIPAILLELLIHIIPMLAGVGISFLQLTLFFLRNWQAAPFAGFSNYAIALNFSAPTGQALLHSFTVTILYTAIVLAVAWLFGMAAAVFTQRAFRGRGAGPHPVPHPVRAAGLRVGDHLELHAPAGHRHGEPAAAVPAPGALRRPFWLIGQDSFWSLVVVQIWRTWPFAFLILTAGLQSIPADLYEAAALDGAGILGQVRHVTLPLLRPVNRVLLLVLFLWTFNDFSVPFTLFGSAPPTQADIISIHIYENSFVSWNFGTGSAMSVLLLLFLLLVTVASTWRVGRRGERHA